MSEDIAKAISSARRKRGVDKASITCLTNRIAEVEHRVDPSKILQAQQLLTNLQKVDSDFQTHHLEMVELIEDEATLGHEQSTLDLHDDTVADLTTRLNVIISSQSASADPEKVVSKRLCVP